MDAITLGLAARQGIRQLLLFTATGEGACPLRCSYCFLPKRGDTEVMSVGTLRRAVAFLTEVATGEPSLLFFGTEPTMQWRLIEEVRRYTDMPFSLTTNGYLLTRKRIDWCNANGVRVHVYSIDGGTGHNGHRLDRRGRETWETVARHFRYLAESQGVWLTARATWTPDDYDLAGRFRAFEALGAQSIQVVPDVEGGVVWDETRVERAYLELGETYEWRGTPSRYVNEMLAAIAGGAPKPGDPCNSGRGYWAVMPDGTLRTCQRGRTIGDIWRGVTDPRPLIESTLVSAIVNSGMRIKSECTDCVAFPRCPGPGFCAAANREALGNPAVPTEAHCAHLRGMVRACGAWAERQRDRGVGRVLTRNVLGVTYGEVTQERSDGSAPRREAAV